MNLYIDCEYNDFQGPLISMALVAEDGREWYGVLPCPHPSPWVAEHVIPILGQKPESMESFQIRLEGWLLQFDSIHVIADWPEDIAHFCKALITDPGCRIHTPPLTLEVKRLLEASPSENPHNALEDARGIRKVLMR